MLKQSEILRGTLAAGMLLAGTAVQADIYTGAQVSMMKIDRGAVSDVTLTDLTLRGGMVLHQLVSAEVHVGKAFDDDSYRGVEVENDFHYGVFARLTPPVGGPVRPYLIGGYSYVENDFNGETQRDDGVSYGGGFDLGLEEHLNMSLEYLRLVDNDFGKQELIGLGLNYRF